MGAAQQIDGTVAAERRDIAVLLLVMVPILFVLVHWLNLPAGERLYLGGSAEAYLDPDGGQAISDVVAQGDLFLSATGKTANLGVRSTPQGAFWLRLPLAPVRGQLDVTAEAILALSFEEPRFRRVDLYLVGPQHQQVVASSFVRDAATGYRFPVFSLPASALAADFIYARIITASSMRATIYLAPEPVFNAVYARTNVGFALLLGLMAASAAYLVPLGLVLRNSTYLSLGAAMMFAGLYVASDQALLETYLLPGAIRLSRAASLAAVPLFYGAFLVFAVRFLELGRQSQRLRRIVDALAVTLLALGVAAVFDGFADAGLLRRFLPYAGLVAGVVLVGILSARAWFAPRRALLFAIMWLPLLVTGLLRVQLDAAPSQGADPIALNCVYFGFAISLLLFAVVTPLELYRSELRLRRETQSLLARLESFARIGRDVYFESDPAGRLVYLAGDGSGAREPDADAMLDRVIAGGLPERPREALSAAQAMARPLRNHIFAIGEPGEQRWYSLSGAPADDTANFRGIVRDVSAEIEQENQRQQERHLISLGGLAATVAHEINNVVQPIINMSKGLREHTRTVPTAERMLDLIDLAAQQAATLVQQILKVGARGSNPPPLGREIDLAVRDAIETLRLILPTSMTLETRVEAVAEVTVRPGDILQVLINVVANARRASGDAGTIRVELVPTATGALLSVIDSGAGMTEAQRQRAADPYFTTKQGDGTAGIGLSVVKRLVEEHGGSLAISSRPGAGTRIDLAFPRRSGDAP